MLRGFRRENAADQKTQQIAEDHHIRKVQRVIHLLRNSYLVTTFELWYAEGPFLMVLLT
jgi:hypothetical protein